MAKFAIAFDLDTDTLSKTYGGNNYNNAYADIKSVLEKNGFTRCGIIHVADGTPRIAYQRLSREGMAR